MRQSRPAHSPVEAGLLAQHPFAGARSAPRLVAGFAAFSKAGGALPHDAVGAGRTKRAL